MDYNINEKDILKSRLFCYPFPMRNRTLSFPPLRSACLAAALAALVLLALPAPSPRAVAAEGPGKGDHRVIQLPNPTLKGKMTLEEAMSKRASIRDFRQRALTQEEIGQILWSAGGQTRPWGGRTVPSAGALYPLEIDIATPEGVFRYLPERHQLQPRATGNLLPKLAAAALNQHFVAQAPAVVVISAVYERTKRRYGSRAERYVHMEAGHAAQNIHLEAVSLGLGSVAVGAFNDSEVHRVLALRADEKPLYLIPVGEPAQRP